MTGTRYLWFAAYAGLWPSFRMEHRLADALASAGRDVTMLRCDGVLDDFCQVMASQRLHVDSPRIAKRATCRDCMANARMTAAVASYRTTALDSYVTPEITATADTLIAAVDESNWQDFEFADMQVGRWAAYTSMLRHRLPNVDDSPEFWVEYLAELRQSLVVAAALPALLDDVRPTHAVVYNALYPNHRVFAELSQRAGAQLVALHAGSFVPNRYETVGIYQHITASQTAVDSRSIGDALDVALSPQEIGAVGRQLTDLAAGRDPWVYSSAPRRENPAALRSHLGLRPDSQVVVALLSSPDETRAAVLVDAQFTRDPSRGYSDISEFIRAVHALAEDRPEVDFVLRLHPRMAPNKRDPATSPDLGPILEALRDLPSNAHINGPDDGISMYDLIGIASAAVNQSSSAGLEFLALGLPVVNYDPVRQGAYPAEFGMTADRHDRAGMAEAVDEALVGGPDLQFAVKAFRWYATVCLRSVLLLSDVTATSLTPAVATAPAPPMLPRVRRFIPASVRERVARSMARRARTNAFRAGPAESSWSDEWLMRLDATVGSDLIWNPPVIVRGVSDPDGEASAVAAVLGHLRQLLGYDLDAERRPVASV